MPQDRPDRSWPDLEHLADNTLGRGAEHVPQHIEGYREVAHQPLDHPRAKSVLACKTNAARYCQPVISDAADVFARRSDVLDVAKRKAADRGCPDAEESRSGIGSVPLKIPVERPGPRRLGQSIRRQGKMVDADRLIARGDKALRRRLRLLQAGAGGGQHSLVDQSLVRRHPRHVRVAEERDPVGLHGKRLIHGEFEARNGLVRQPVERMVAPDGCGRPNLRRNDARFARSR